MKKLIKTVILLLVTVILFAFGNILPTAKAIGTASEMAEGGAGAGGTTKVVNPADWEPVEETSNKFATVGGTIVSIIKVIGTIVSVGALSLIGIKYMIGSAEDKAEYKKSMIPYLIGAVMLFACSNIVQMIYEASHDL